MLLAHYPYAQISYPEQSALARDSEAQEARESHVFHLREALGISFFIVIREYQVSYRVDFRNRAILAQ